MGSNPTGFKITDTAAGWAGADFEDVFVRKDCFLEGGLWTWGCAGGLGNNTAGNSIAHRSSPVQTISGGTNWKSVSTFTHHAAIKTDGTLWLWGVGGQGVLGNNATIPRSSPVQTISGGTDWRSVSVADKQSAAIKTDGTLWVWGYGGAGQLGTNSSVRQSSPVQTISSGTNWKSVSVSGSYLGFGNTAAIKTDGTLWTWGANNSGTLGTNATISRSSPVQTISGGTNWKSLSMGYSVVASIKTDGTLWIWGFNSYGMLGDNSTLNRSSPVQTISGGENWKSVSGGTRHTAAIKTDGTLWLWGSGGNGQLGDNSSVIRSSPVQTISGGTNWRSVSACQLSTTAIKTDGTLWSWGVNSFGQLGDNSSVARRSSPVQTISGGTNWRIAAIGSYNLMAIREDCW